jgi:chromosome segregation ATPase
MGIEWAKAEERPEKTQKVEGRFLLDLRAKVNDLEKDVAELKDVNNDLKKKLNEKINENSELETSIKELKENNEILEDIVSEKESYVEELKEKKTNLEVKKNKLEEDLDQSQTELKELNRSINERKREINELNKVITQRENEIKKLNLKIEEMKSEHYEELEDLKSKMTNTLANKDEEIDQKLGDINKLKDRLVQQVSESSKLNDQLRDYEVKVEEVEAAPKIVVRIKDIMQYKGFLSEKEFQKLLTETK